MSSVFTEPMEDMSAPRGELVYDQSEGKFVKKAKKPRAAKTRKPRKSKKNLVIDDGAKNTQFLFTFYSLLAPPLLISIVSIIHIYDLFRLGNGATLAWAQAIGFEVLGISSIVAMRQMQSFSTFTKAAIWGVILILTLYMMVGNIFSVYLNINSSLLKNFSEMSGVTSGGGRLVAVMIGGVLPLISLFFLKILSNFWYTKKGSKWTR